MAVQPTFATISSNENVARHSLRLLRVADLLREYGIHSIRVLFESGQRSTILDGAAKLFDMFTEDRLRVVLAQKCAIHLEQSQSSSTLREVRKK